MTDPSCNTYRPVAMFSSPFTFDRQLGAAYEPPCSNNACQATHVRAASPLSTVWRFLEIGLAFDDDFNGGFEVFGYPPSPPWGPSNLRHALLPASIGTDSATRPIRIGQEQKFPANAPPHHLRQCFPPLCPRGQLRKNVALNVPTMSRTWMRSRNLLPLQEPRMSTSGVGNLYAAS